MKSKLRFAVDKNIDKAQKEEKTQEEEEEFMGRNKKYEHEGKTTEEFVDIMKNNIERFGFHMVD